MGMMKELHLIEYHCRLLEYVAYFHQLQVEWYGMGYFSPLKVEVFSAPGDPIGYNDKPISCMECWKLCKEKAHTC
jgi:hypothetical protein